MYAVFFVMYFSREKNLLINGKRKLEEQWLGLGLGLGLFLCCIFSCCIFSCCIFCVVFFCVVFFVLHCIK